MAVSSPLWQRFCPVLLACVAFSHAEAATAPWTPIGPPGAAVTAILVDPGSAAVFLGTQQGGIFASTDSGATWEKLYTGPPCTAISDFAVIEGSLYAALGEPRSGCVSPDTGGVIRSRNGGRTWTGAGLDGQHVSSLRPDPLDPAALYAASTGAVSRSSDGGQTWQTIFPTAGNRILAVGIDPTNPSLILVGTSIGPFKSVDRGVTFRPIRHRICPQDPSCGYAAPALPFSTTAFLFDPSLPGTVYGQSPAGTFQSRDWGENWNLFGLSFGAVAMDPARPGQLYGASSKGVFTGASSGVWTPVGGVPPSDFSSGVLALAPDPGTPGRLYVGTGWGPFRSDDGGRSWGPASEFVRDLPVTAFAFAPSDPMIAYAAQYNRGVFKTTDGGRRWILAGYQGPNPLIETLAVDPFDPDHLLAFTSDSYDWMIGDKRALQSTDGGASWALGVPIPDYVLFGAPRSLLADPMAPGVWYLAHNSDVSVTRDGGLSWESGGLHDLLSVPPFPNVYALAADPNRPGVVYAAQSGGLYRSDNHGRSWALTDRALSGARSLAVDPRDSSVYGVTASGLVNTVRGILWNAKIAPASESLLSVSADPSSGAIYLATASGVFRSTDAGVTWQALGGDLEPLLAPGLYVHPKNGRLAASTRTGIYGRNACSDAGTLCLGNGRFLVRARWTSPDGQSGDGRAEAVSDDSGYFWFFTPGNIEMMAKIVSGCAVNSRTWFFAAGLTNIGVVTTVTDVQTGTVQTYVNPQGTSFQPIQDTVAFETCSTARESGLAAAAERPARNTATTIAASGACRTDATTLCISGGRFQVKAKWTMPDGASGAAQAVSLTGDTGYFWFFGAGSAELIVKVVSGCDFNSRYWTFAAGLTDVNVVTTVTDTQTGEARIYSNPQGMPFVPVLDAAAFATCP